MSGQHDDLRRLAARVDDNSILSLMGRMRRNYRRAERQADVAACDLFEAAYAIYRDEARRRGLIR